VDEDCLTLISFLVVLFSVLLLTSAESNHKSKTRLSYVFGNHQKNIHKETSKNEHKTKLSKLNNLHPHLTRTSVSRGVSHYGCEVCIGFMNQAISNLIDIIAQIGIGGGCAAVCGKLPSPWEQQICMVLCEIVGIEEFNNLVNDLDPDPIWICMEIDVCPYNKYAAGKVTSVKTSPSAGPMGTTFTVTAGYTITNTTGTGQIILAVIPPSEGEPFGWEGTIIGQAPGQYTISESFTANPSENEPFTPGPYQTLCEVCEGSCGSTHSGEFIIAQGSGLFRITG